jgi:hypothetical protein
MRRIRRAALAATITGLAAVTLGATSASAHDLHPDSTATCTRSSFVIVWPFAGSYFYDQTTEGPYIYQGWGYPRGTRVTGPVGGTYDGWTLLVTGDYVKDAAAEYRGCGS